MYNTLLCLYILYVYYTDMNPFETYQQEIKSIRRELRQELKSRSLPHKIALGEHLRKEREKGKRVQDIFDDLGTNNRNLMYECMEAYDEQR